MKFCKTHLGLLVFLMSFSIGITAQNKLNKKEKKIATYVADNSEEAFEFLSRVVNINSGTLNLEGVKEVGMIFGEEFTNLGMTSDWIEMPTEVNRAGHLFAESKGTKGKRLLLIGHLDTVFPKTSDFQSMEQVSGDVFAGPGAADMKGGDVVILYALKALHEIGALKDTQIIVALTGDEEKPGSPLATARQALIDAGHRSDLALGFETGHAGYGVTARRGSSSWHLEVKGTRSHSSRIFSENVGSGAIFEAARILNAFHEEVKGEKYLTFNAGVILGGTDVDFDNAKGQGTAFGKTNVVPQILEVDGGLRTISADQEGRAQAKMQAIVDSGNHPGTSATIVFKKGYPSMSPKPESDALLAQYDEISKLLGYGEIKPYDPGKRGAADISFVPFIPGIDGLGVYGGGAHTPQETVDKSSLEIAIKRAAILIYRLTR